MGRRTTAVLTAVAAMVLLGSDAGGPDGPRQDGKRPSFTLRAHKPYVLSADYPSQPRGPADFPRLTPAFGNTGDAAASRGVLLRVDVGDAHFLPVDTSRVHDNCYYEVDGRTIYCEFPDAVPVGAAYETAEPLPEITSPYAEIKSAYRYAVWPLDDPPSHLTNYKKHFKRGSGPALGLVPVDIGTLHGDGVLRFAMPKHSARADWSVKGITIRGRVGEYASVNMAGVSEGSDRARVELPPGTSLAPLSWEERARTPSEAYTCGRDDLDGHVYCDTFSPYVTLRVRIDRRIEGAEGRLSVPGPIAGDTHPANNSAPVKLEITGTAPPEETDPPVAERAAGSPG
ncbi:hypothetical protein DMH15_07515 [Streptomyces sp. WAC 06725]|uniref:hypothetical protein n=1 Tax=Streptomyces sp. WAC 06725 TaxID=2203209 RepID=UPI000F73665E|nr:hypothetical protein [Streptomyces sp. WAC 06725]RSO46416.1 hypothetical protein DMH15_07515 [Streptomyces sp. WAC 06725]